MDFSGKVFLASIEEDNIQRALFRVRPLLDARGAVSQEDLESIGDEGFMRVVPDKQEQYTFKERMRSLGAMCLIDLRRTDADSHKVRPNKNYAPSRGESNRFVIYSDVIQPVGGLAVCEVVSDPRTSAPVTSCYYLRSGGHIEGPYDKLNGRPVDALSCIAPDSDRLFAVSMPDERERLFFWPAEAAEEKRSEEPAALSAAERIQQIEAELPPLRHEVEQAEAENGSDWKSVLTPAAFRGTPLQRSASRRLTEGSEGASLHQVVDRVVRKKRGELRREPADPAEQLGHSLARLWQKEEGRRQAADSFLAMEGARELLGFVATDAREPLVVQALRDQLQALEAERLALMVELDRLRGDRALLIREACEQKTEELQALSQKEDELKRDVGRLEQQLAELRQQRGGLLEAAGLTPPQPAQDTTLEFASKIVAEALTKLGFVCERDDAMNLLLHSLLFPVVKLASPYLADAALAARGFAGAIGCQESLVIAPVYEGELEGVTQLLPVSLAKPAFDQEEVHLMQAWPVIPLRPGAGFQMDGEAQGIVIKPQQLLRQAESQSRDLPESALELLSQVDEMLRDAGHALPLAFRRGLTRYLRCAQSQLEGGVAAALDYAVCCWVLPFMRLSGVDTALLGRLLTGLPRTQLYL